MTNNPPPSSGAQFRPMVPGQQGQHFVPDILGETSSPDTHCVFVETNLDSCLALPVHKDEIISNFKDKLLKQHKQVFPQIGEIIISALKVKLRGKFYHLSNSMNVYKAFDGFRKNWFMYVDAVKVEEGELLTIMAAGDKRSNLELVKEFTIGSKLEDGHTKDLILEKSLETELVEKKTRKRKNKSSDGKTSRKKSKVDFNQSNGDITTLCGELPVIENGEKKGVGTEENHETSDADKILDENIVTVNSDLVDGHNMDVVKDGPDNNTVKEALEKLDDLTRTEEPELEKGRKSASIVVIDQEKDLPPASELADGQIASHDEERVTLKNSFVEAIQKETEVGMNSADGVGRANTETDNLVSYPENLVEANSALTTSPVTEKKKKRKRSSKDHINQSATAVAATVTATTASREIVHKISGVSENIDADTTSELCPISKKGNLGIENEMGKKIIEDVESRKAIPSSSDNTHTDNLVSYPQNQLVVSSGLTTGPTTEKKKKQKKSKKDQLTTATTTSKKLVNEAENVSGSIDATSDTLVDAIQNENAMGEQCVCKVGSREDTIFNANNSQVSGLASTLTALIHESQMLDETGKSMDENPACEHDVSKENVERDADEAKSVKSTNKKSSKKAKTQAKENIVVDSGSQNVEPIKVVNRDGPENVIRDVLDSLQQREEAEENLDKKSKKSSKRSKKKNSLNIGDEGQVVNTLQQKNKAEENLEKNVKKSSKRSVKKDSLDIVEKDQILSVEVNTAAQKEASPINNSKDTDTPFTPLKKNTDDITLSMQNLRENADMADNFGSGQKDTIVDGEKEDQVTGGAKTEKEKKSLDLHPSGSIDGSIKPKDRKGRVQPSSSGTSHLQSKAMDDSSGSKVDQFDASVKGAVNNKKEAVKKSSNLATLKKSKMNDNKKKETVKTISNSVTSNKRKTNFFKDVEKWNSAEDESKTTSHDSTKTPSDSSSEDDSDVTSMSRRQGNNLVGGTNRFSGSLHEIVRSSKSYKAAKLTASQSPPDEFDNESLGLDVVPDSQAI